MQAPRRRATLKMAGSRRSTFPCVSCSVRTHLPGCDPAALSRARFGRVPRAGNRGCARQVTRGQRMERLLLFAVQVR